MDSLPVSEVNMEILINIDYISMKIHLKADMSLIKFYLIKLINMCTPRDWSVSKELLNRTSPAISTISYLGFLMQTTSPGTMVVLTREVIWSMNGWLIKA